ncbi:hypothetical protein [Salibacterium qingdaonense]|uniref:Copper amine oxidase N-terminal domain-containing protein n=1 Tax=Salibacterium qingdaonense TaxID=266892 RepID=A0A1I4IGI5_9BACI|nr:hypothetical protein [Salibacterium qingdaonense]SFL53394.1 hypothetical protein SAMN04488054_10235 [Salibacterium qingdaonense]
MNIRIVLGCLMTLGLLFSAVEADARTLFQTDTGHRGDNEQKQLEEETEENRLEHDLYIDGQLQTHTGGPVFQSGILYVPIQAAVQVMNDKEDIDRSVPYEGESSIDFLKEQDYIEEVDNQDVVRVSNLQKLDIRAEWIDNPGRLHLETADLLTAGDMRIGDSMEEVDNTLDINWNTGFGKPSDYIGFHGNMHEFTYTNRYGEERSGEVPDMQLEIIDDELTYMIFSSTDFETAKGAAVGDTLFDVRRLHGSEYIEQKIDGKTVHIYHVNDGSLWFIANEEEEVERIGIWGFQLEGYER